MEKEIIIEQLPEEILRAGNLPSLPTVTTKILKLTKDENASIKDLVKVLSVDPALTTKILKIANSSFYKRGSDVTSIQRAAGALGINTVKTIALSFSLPKFEESDEDVSHSLDFDAYWKQCLTTAIAARELARLIKCKNSEEAFLCGLLSHLGQLVMFNCIPGDYSKVLEKSEDKLPSSELEQSILGFTHQQVCAAIMCTWQFPELVYVAARFWNDLDELPEDADSDIRMLCGILHLAASISSVYYESDNGEAMHAIQEKALNLFEIEEDDFFGLVGELKESIEEVSDLFS